MSRSSLLFLALLACATGCITQKNTLAAIENRAAADFQCDEPLEVHDFGHRQYGVRGCGQSAVFRLVCTGSSPSDCAAVRNNRTSSGHILSRRGINEARR